MTPGDEVPPPPLPPPASRGAPFGFWSTLGWSALIALAGLMAQGAILAACVFAAGAVGLDVPKDPALLAQNGLALSLATIASAPFVVGLSWLIASMRRGYSVVEYLGLQIPNRPSLVRWILILGCFLIASDWITILLGREVVPEFMIHAMQTAVIPPLLWLAVIVAAPLSEEFFFRGFFFKGLEHALGRAAAILVTSTLWTLIHQQYDLYQMAWIFSAGILLGIARVTTGSLVLCILMHALMNLIATIQAAIYMARNSAP